MKVYCLMFWHLYGVYVSHDGARHLAGIFSSEELAKSARYSLCKQHNLHESKFNIISGEVDGPVYLPIIDPNPV